MLDERALRRADFVEGFPVTLADGQEWTLPPVRLRCVPDDGPDGFRFVAVGLGSEYEAAFLAATRADGAAEVIRTELALARRLLLRNYDLTIEQVAELIRFDYAAEPDPEADAIRQEVMRVAMGRAVLPKAKSATSP